MALTHERMREKRDNKVNLAMRDLAPIWLVNEEYRPREDSLVFNLVYLSPVDGWVSERFKYDAFNDVLYHMGTRRLSEEETMGLQEHDPFISAEVATHVPNSPAGRPNPPLIRTPGTK
jgi:hypothetical protein